MKKILVVGSSNVDFVLRVKEAPRKGETIRAKTFEKLPGGKGANQACAVGKLGGECVFLSVIGNDDVGKLLIESLSNANVELKYLRRDNRAPTGMALITVNDEGDNSIVIAPGANSLCDKEYFRENTERLRETDILLTQLETPVEAIYSLLEEAKKIKKLTILNPAPAPDFLPDNVLNGLDFITPNETELEKLTGMKTEALPEIVLAAKSLLARGVKNVLVTIGPRGAFLCNNKEETLFPAFVAESVDSTAAGDIFNAGVAVGLSDGLTLHEAIEMANAAASISISRPGAQTSIPDRKEVEKLLRTARKLL